MRLLLLLLKLLQQLHLLALALVLLQLAQELRPRNVCARWGLLLGLLRRHAWLTRVAQVRGVLCLLCSQEVSCSAVSDADSALSPTCTSHGLHPTSVRAHP